MQKIGLEGKFCHRATTWMKLGDILLSEITQSQKGKFCMIPLKCATLNSQNDSNRE